MIEATAEPAAMAELDRMLSLADEVIRHKVIRLPDKVAGRARRPQYLSASTQHQRRSQPRTERERPMANGNHVSIIGNLTRDPELRFTPSGQATASFGVAVNRRWQNRQTQEWEEATSFLDVVCWGQLAENAAQSLGRGARVMVDGRLDQRSWENPEGEKRSKIEITADEVAPSLRWATVQITKNERRGPDGPGGEPTTSYRPATSAPAPAHSGGGGGSNYADEEPF